MGTGFSNRWCNRYSNVAAHGKPSWSFRFEDAAANWLGYRRGAWPRLDAIRVQIGPHRLFVALFLRLLEGSGGPASDSADALASARLELAADKRVVVPAYKSFVTPLRSVASPSGEACVPAFS